MIVIIILILMMLPGLRQDPPAELRVKEELGLQGAAAYCRM